MKTWKEFKVGFKKQIYPENAKETAMKRLRGPKHAEIL